MRYSSSAVFTSTTSATMKCVIIFVSCVLASVYAVYGGGAHSFQHNSGPIGGPSSYVYSSPAVHGYSHAAPIAHGYAHGYAHVGHYGDEVRIVDPVAVAAGAPLPVGDTHEVAIAKAEHFKAHAVAKERLHASSLGHGYTHAYSAPVSHEYAHIAPITHGFAHVGHYGSEVRIVDPAAVAAGAPLPVGDTHEVAIAKAEHFKAHAIARSRLPTAPIAHGYVHATPVDHEYAHGYAHAAPAAYGYGHAAPVTHGYAHAAPLAHGYAHGTSVTRLVNPVAIAAGAPLPGGDTYEVAAAKAAHLQAHAAVKNGHLGLY